MSRAVRICLAILVPVFVLAGQDFSQIRVEELAKGYDFTEGPAWSKDGFLIFSETPSNLLLKWTPGQTVQPFRPNANGPSGNAFDAQGRLYTCETHTRRVVRTDKTGAIEVLADKWEGKRLNAPNDVVVSKTGHVYFTDPAFGEQSDHRELDFYGVYHIPPKGPMKLVAKPTGRPRGIALSPNGRTLYVVNADERNVRAYEVDHNGDVSGERVLIPHIAAIPGGIQTDPAGKLYIAADGVAIYTAEGEPVHVIAMKDHPSNCTFGDPEGKVLIVTAHHGIYRIRLDGKGAN
jgi:gluconolactonase